MNTMTTGFAVLGHTYTVWRALQKGQEQVIRWGGYRQRFPGRLREQNGHEHRCSVYFLCSTNMIRMRPYVDLDETLLLDCVCVHDEAEGILKIDIAAPLKTADDDLREYEAFARLYRDLGGEVWKSKQRSFLLQFCLYQPNCFDEEAQAIMGELARTRRNEALFFHGIEMLDYLFYAYEGGNEAGVDEILQEVANNQVENLDRTASELPGFGEVVWTAETREYFAGACGLCPMQTRFL